MLVASKTKDSQENFVMAYQKNQYPHVCPCAASCADI
jgi:hypothetical protein